MKAFSICVTLAVLAAVSMADEQCEVKTTNIVIPDLLGIGECVKTQKNNLIVNDLEDFYESKWFNENLDDTKYLVDIAKKLNTDVTLDISSLTSCDIDAVNNNKTTDATNQNVINTLLGVHRLLMCVDVSQLATPVGLINLSIGLGFTLANVIANLLKGQSGQGLIGGLNELLSDGLNDLLSGGAADKINEVQNTITNTADTIKTNTADTIKNSITNGLTGLFG